MVGLGKILSLCSIGNLFVSVKIWYPMKEKVGSQFFKAHKNTIAYMIPITYLQRLVEWVGHGVPTHDARRCDMLKKSYNHFCVTTLQTILLQK